MNASPIITIAFRDLLKFRRDPIRIVSTLIFPLIFVAVLGGSLQKNLGAVAGYNFLGFTFTGVFAQTVFQSAALGVVSLIEDRENDFSQEIFVAPISRYAIVFGKILGESSVAMCQGVALLAMGFVLRVPMDIGQALSLIPVAVICCLFGGAFGIMLLANMPSQRSAQQLFPFVFLPQFFLAGVFAPIKQLPWYLEVLSILSPLRYAVDLTRGVFYIDSPDRSEVVLQSIPFNLAIISAGFIAFMIAGTWLFVRAERNR
jgi:ABC-2 type transport system permease protein